MDTKKRAISASISGTLKSSVGTTNFLTSKSIESQLTRSESTPFPVVRHALRSGVFKGTGAEWVFTHSDYGSSFITEKSTISSSLSGLTLRAQQGTASPFYEIVHNGPCFLTGSTLIPFYTDAELSNAEQELWTKGAAAINRVRPNKPALDLPVLVGELRKDGIPTVIGSLFSRTRTLRDVYRNSGKEYLNVQFGWAPLVRDLITLVQLIPESRRRIEQYERDIGKLVRRRYHFPDLTQVDTNLQFTADSSNYKRASGTPWGSVPEDHVTFRPSGQVPEQVNRVTTKTWFSGGFRFYHRSVPEALQELSLLEEKANLLLGTRLDPEVVYNLAPWTWLADWFINFGDAIGNASALLSDDLVMQYGYLMRTTHWEQTTSWPQGLWYRTPTGPFSSVWRRHPSGAYSQTLTRVTKQRGKASPFGFGLNSADFSANQIAILAALGLSRT